jgi:hypothetical protein
METTTVIDKKKVTNSTSVSNFSGFTGFLETEDGRILTESCEMTANRRKLVSRIVKLASLGVAVAMYFAAGLFNAICYGLIFFLLGSIVTFVFGRIAGSARNKYFDARWNHGLKIAEAVGGAMGMNYYSFYNGELFLYSSEMCMLIWVEDGKTITYNRNNIKEVTLEHVHLGSTSTSTSSHSGSSYAWTNNYATYKGKTNTTTSTVDQYEWRLDVFSNFMEYPKISLVFDEKEENAAKQIYAIVK